jgi:hypothetical protein
MALGGGLLVGYGLVSCLSSFLYLDAFWLSVRSMRFWHGVWDTIYDMLGLAETYD